MLRYFIGVFFVLTVLFTRAQVDSTLKVVDSTKSILDTITLKKDSIALQDTVKKETRAERKVREKAEKERKKYYYKDILKDSARLEIEHISNIAWKRSLMLPGWGQITNGGDWLWVKLPIIYGGFVSAYLVFDYWNWHYQKFVKEAAYRIDNNGATNDPDLVGFSSTDMLIRAKDNYRRNRDMTILITAVWWAGNVVEAYVDSMLKNRYNISDDLSFKISPTFLPPNSIAFNSSFASQFAPGVKLTFILK